MMNISQKNYRNCGIQQLLDQIMYIMSVNDTLVHRLAIAKYILGIKLKV